MKRKLTATVMLAACCVICAMARASDIPDYFGKSISARAIGMGRSRVAVLHGTDVIYWNPAGLAYTQFPLVDSTHNSLGDFDMRTNTLSAVIPAARGAYGLSLFRSTIDDILITGFSETTGLTTLGSFSQKESGVMVSYGMSPEPGYAVGATLKQLSMSAYDLSQNGWGLDLGGLYQVDDSLLLGINLQNLSGMSLGPDRIPFNMKFGVAWSLRQWDSAPDLKDRLTFALDWNSNLNGGAATYMGVEYRVVPELTLRAGSADGIAAFGAGVNLNNIELNYAMSDEEIGKQQYFTVSYKFDLPAPGRETAEEQPPEDTIAEKPGPDETQVEPPDVQEPVVDTTPEETPSPETTETAETQPEPDPNQLIRMDRDRIQLQPQMFKFEPPGGGDADQAPPDGAPAETPPTGSESPAPESSVPAPGQEQPAYATNWSLPPNESIIHVECMVWFTDQKTGAVAFQTGALDGHNLHRGDVVYVFRDDQPVAQVELTQVDPHKSYGTITQADKQILESESDIVGNRMGIRK